jgi:hypothetical protein
VIPDLLYVALGAVAFALADKQGWAGQGLAVVVVAILLAAIRNEWDLITWIALRQDTPEPNCESDLSGGD